jgi:hypothetical protein
MTLQVSVSAVREGGDCSQPSCELQLVRSVDTCTLHGGPTNFRALQTICERRLKLFLYLQSMWPRPASFPRCRRQGGQGCQGDVTWRQPASTGTASCQKDGCSLAGRCKFDAGAKRSHDDRNSLVPRRVSVRRGPAYVVADNFLRSCKGISASSHQRSLASAKTLGASSTSKSIESDHPCSQGNMVGHFSWRWGGKH